MFNDERKDRSIVHIRDLNNLLIRDTYPVPLQSNITVNFREYTHISIFDVFSFFYQWRVYFDY